MSVTFGSLFSGIGGFDLGFERAGMTGLWACEIDPQARITLGRHFPTMTIYDDVRTIGKRNLRSADVICGGFPCQDLSVAGKRKGLAGERSGLWHEFRRIVSELRPQCVVIENVPGLLSSNGGRDFAVLIRGLAELGYGVAWRVLDSQYFGVPQRRRRVFIVGSLGNGRAAEILLEPESVCGYPAPRREAGKETAAVSGTLSANGGGTSRPAGNCNELDFCVPVAKCLTAGYGSRQDSETETFVIDQEMNPTRGFAGTHKANGSPQAGVVCFDKDCGANHGFYAGEVSPTLRIDKTPAIAFNWQAGASKGMPVSDNQSPTLIVNQTPAVTHGYAVRRFTPKETERLQGFPDDWTSDHSDTARYRMTGNAVTVNVAEWIGRRIVEAVIGS